MPPSMPRSRGSRPRSPRRGRAASPVSVAMAVESRGEPVVARARWRNPGLCCPTATLGADAERHGATLRQEFAAGVRRYLDLFAELMPSTSRKRRREAITTLSTLIGALTLARACAGADDDLSDEVLAAVREELTSRSRG